MKTIVILAQKGGVGKSMVADELAFSFSRSGLPFSFYDLDAQGGTLHTTQITEGAQATIVDTPGALQADYGRWISEADAVILPTRASGRDIPPLLRVANLVQERHKKGFKFYVVVNFWNRYSATRDFIEWISKKDIKYNDVLIIPQSESIVQASIAGISVVKYSPNSPAAVAVLNMCNKIRSDLGFPWEEI